MQFWHLLATLFAHISVQSIRSQVHRNVGRFWLQFPLLEQIRTEQCHISNVEQSLRSSIHCSSERKSGQIQFHTIFDDYRLRFRLAEHCHSNCRLYAAEFHQKAQLLQKSEIIQFEQRHKTKRRADKWFFTLEWKQSKRFLMKFQKKSIIFYANIKLT